MNSVILPALCHIHLTGACAKRGRSRCVRCVLCVCCVCVLCVCVCVCACVCVRVLC